MMLNYLAAYFSNKVTIFANLGIKEEIWSHLVRIYVHVGNRGKIHRDVLEPNASYFILILNYLWLFNFGCKLVEKKIGTNSIF